MAKRLTKQQIEVLERKSWALCGKLRMDFQDGISKKSGQILKLKREGELNKRGIYNTEVRKHIRSLSKKELVVYISNRIATSDVFRLYDLPKYEEFRKELDAKDVENPYNFTVKQQKLKAKLEQEVLELTEKRDKLTHMHRDFMDEVILEGQGELLDKLKDFENIIAIV